GDKTLTLFCTYQPCHHSGGHRKLKWTHRKSCCGVLKRWARDALKPQSVKLRFKCFDLNRIHWTDDELIRSADDKTMFGGRAALARAGVRDLLLETNVSVSMMTKEDWTLFLALLKDYWGYEPPKVTDEQWANRHAHETRCQQVLASV